MYTDKEKKTRHKKISKTSSKTKKTKSAKGAYYFGNISPVHLPPLPLYLELGG
jgi:hypothetical protein